MTLRRAALYTGGASLLVAWFSSAASLSVSRNNNRPAANAEQSASSIEDLASQVQEHSERLRARMASAAKLQPPVRNPFAFRETSPRPPTLPRPVQKAIGTAGPVEPVEPTLSLVGIAEQERAQGLVRTALLVTVGDALIMVTVNDTVLQRYRVTAVGVDAVELTDVLTGRTRRLALDAP